MDHHKFQVWEQPAAVDHHHHQNWPHDETNKLQENKGAQSRCLIHTKAASYWIKVESSINYYPNMLNYICRNPSNNPNNPPDGITQPRWSGSSSAFLICKIQRCFHQQAGISAVQHGNARNKTVRRSCNFTSGLE